MVTEFDPLGGALGALMRQRTAALWFDTATWRDPNGRQLSHRVWLARQSVRDAIDETLRRAIVAGDDPLVVADALERYLLPEHRVARGADGEPLPGQPKRIVTITPNPPGYARLLDNRRPFAGSYAARRLARTEISRAFAEATRRAAERNPFVRGLRWVISNNHPDPDTCDDYAAHDEGMGRGVYPVRDFPAMPEHPHCRCTAAPAPVADPDDVVNYLRDTYRLHEGDAPGSAPPPLDERLRLLRELWSGWSWLGGAA